MLKLLKSLIRTDAEDNVIPSKIPLVKHAPMLAVFIAPALLFMGPITAMAVAGVTIVGCLLDRSPVGVLTLPLAISSGVMAAVSMLGLSALVLTSISLVVVGLTGYTLYVVAPTVLYHLVGEAITTATTGTAEDVITAALDEEDDSDTELSDEDLEAIYQVRNEEDDSDTELSDEDIDAVSAEDEEDDSDTELSDEDIDAIIAVIDEGDATGPAVNAITAALDEAERQDA